MGELAPHSVQEYWVFALAISSLSIHFDDRHTRGEGAKQFIGDGAGRGGYVVGREMHVTLATP